ncbi:MAG: hypothetical protein IT428_26260 [Planctomycetaceae bacterium]|nr:hypothetical protein [Planctomycetaceae bacterium]
MRPRLLIVMAIALMAFCCCTAPTHAGDSPAEQLRALRIAQLQAQLDAADCVAVQQAQLAQRQRRRRPRRRPRLQAQFFQQPQFFSAPPAVLAPQPLFLTAPQPFISFNFGRRR